MGKQEGGLSVQTLGFSLLSMEDSRPLGLRRWRTCGSTAAVPAVVATRLALGLGASDLTPRSSLTFVSRLTLTKPFTALAPFCLLGGMLASRDDEGWLKGDLHEGPSWSSRESASPLRTLPQAFLRAWHTVGAQQWDTGLQTDFLMS